MNAPEQRRGTNTCKVADDHGGRKFFEQVFGAAWITQGIAVAAELGIADLLAAGSRTAKELAQMTQTHHSALYRILRALGSVGVFSEDGSGRFSLTPLAEMLRTNVANTQRPYAMMMGAEFHGAWGKLLHSARTGEPGFQRCFGMPFFQYMLEHPGRHSVYDDAMTTIHGAETEPLLDACDFAGCGTVVDVGGGQGLLLAALLSRCPSAQGILFDMPVVAERARPTIAALGLESRCRVAGGDFFHSVPRGADAYLLRHILHDWEDAAAVRILQNCREAMIKDGRVLVAEMVIPPGNAPAFAKWLDLMMLLVGGRERTQEEYAALFTAAGLKLNRLIPTASEVCILEGVRA